MRPHVAHGFGRTAVRPYKSCTIFLFSSSILCTSRGMHPELLNNSTFLRYYQQWQRNPESIVFASIADYFLRYRMIDEAFEICSHGLKRFPNLVSGRLVMVKVYLAKEAWDEALTELHHILSLQPKQHEALLLMEQIKKQLEPVGPVEMIVEAHEPIAHIVPIDDLAMENGLSRSTACHVPTEMQAPQEVRIEIPQATAEASDDDSATEILPTRWKTVTMAQILSSQGHHHKAKQIYLTILAHDPSNQAAQEGLAAEQTSLGA